MSLTYSLRYVPESDPFRRPRVPTYVTPPTRPKLSAEDLENALLSLQSVVDNLKTVLEGFDEDLGRLKERSKKLDREIIHERTRMLDYKRRKIEAQSESRYNSGLGHEQTYGENSNTKNGRWQAHQLAEDMGSVRRSVLARPKRRSLQGSEDSSSSQENNDDVARKPPYADDAGYFSRPTRPHKDSSNKDARTDLEMYWEELKKRNKWSSSRPVDH